MSVAAGASAGARWHFERVYRIRFSHCDPDGIVFFPQYLVLFNHLVEDWFDAGLGVSYAEMIGARRIGLPIVRLECDFRAVSRMGESVRFGLQVEGVGNSSLTLRLDARRAAELRVESRQVLVFTDGDTHRPMGIPDDVRAALGTSAA